ncbi:hypothetical protein ABIF65_004125 [Bradyrhizobium japonicum]|jgi:hypothetical protein|uniref:hypothetical protein n=1 Tax=Bradyrhizobium TaxID=374 RepID=UPI00042320E0|nr:MULTISPECIES: hypothetical protein [Bradyrhizobium]MBR0882483.1 hypothetical protein [Bradyrhizobium liaoningense]MBR1002302.1 hypothetical protein [Bradyrhizobium liaoningense]MBR1032111.1 hypothetical protein [Bradyrhizobium liaoningense]MBR1068587.1 hypothetical protein [Bradyrhizobium liaoningense]MCP1740886.1 hypothetical protein [Bradyrhizobium japonicum]
MYTGYFATTSNRGDWSEAIMLADAESGDIIDITGCRVTLSVADEQGGVRLKASTDDGSITLPDVGTFQWDFDENQMSGLCPGAYNVGVRISRDDRTVQLVIGSVNVMEGIDQQ